MRAHADTSALIDTLRREARSANSEMPLKFGTLDQLVSSSLDNRRFGMVMVAEFAGAALMLAMVGLYGVMAFITMQRTNEIGVRMALGAQRSDILQLILRQALILFGAGIGMGVFLALGSTWVLHSFLFEIGPIDIVTYIVVVLLVGITALLASFVPARRAMAVDPMVALRYE